MQISLLAVSTTYDVTQKDIRILIDLLAKNKTYYGSLFLYPTRAYSSRYEREYQKKNSKSIDVFLKRNANVMRYRVGGNMLPSAKD